MSKCSWIVKWNDPKIAKWIVCSQYNKVELRDATATATAFGWKTKRIHKPRVYQGKSTTPTVVLGPHELINGNGVWVGNGYGLGVKVCLTIGIVYGICSIAMHQNWFVLVASSRSSKKCLTITVVCTYLVWREHLWMTGDLLKLIQGFQTHILMK